MEMFFRFALLVIILVIIFFVYDVLIPKISMEYKVFKEKRIRKQREKAFKKKMKELEIK